MEDRPAGARGAARGGLANPVQVGFDHGPARHVDFGAVVVRAEAPARHIDDDALDLDLGHAFGRVDGQANRLLGLVEIDDGAALDATGLLMGDA